MIRVKMRHVRQLNFCSASTREFFKEHGLDYSLFLSTGLPPEQIEATGDARAIKVAKLARDEALNHG